MKKGVRIINCARGELVEDAALVEALKSGQVGGAALDVFTVEPPKDSPYFGLDNVILTPHIAGSTAEAQEAVGIQIARQIRDYLKLGVVQNAVICPRSATKNTSSSRLTLILPAGWELSLSQTGKGGIEGIQIFYSGSLTEAKTDLVRNSAIAGHAAGLGTREQDQRRHHRGGSGASAFTKRSRTGQARRRGPPMIAVELHSASGTSPRYQPPSSTVSNRACWSMTASMSRRRSKGICWSAATSTYPVFIGKIGTILGEHGVNIANFALGRDRSCIKPVKALAVVQVARTCLRHGGCARCCKLKRHS